MKYFEAFTILILSILGFKYVDGLIKELRTKKQDNKILLYIFTVIISLVSVFGFYKAMVGFGAL